MSKRFHLNDVTQSSVPSLEKNGTEIIPVITNESQALCNQSDGTIYEIRNVKDEITFHMNYRTLRWDLSLPQKRQLVLRVT